MGRCFGLDACLFFSSEKEKEIKKDFCGIPLLERISRSCCPKILASNRSGDLSVDGHLEDRAV